jgi:hypothetical protein
MAPRRGKDEHGVVAAWAEVGECEHHCQVSSVKWQLKFGFFNRISAADTKGWGQFSPYLLLLYGTKQE